MGLYNVVEPCVAGNLQYARPTAEYQPVEVDDELAAPLVAEGKLSAYAPGAETSTSEDDASASATDGDDSGPVKRARRRSTDGD